MAKKSIKNYLKDGSVSVFQFVVAGVHLGLKSTINDVENTEAFVMKHAYGVDEQQTIRERMHKTYDTQQRINKSWSDLKGKIGDWSDILGKESDDAMIEVQNFGEGTI